MKSILITRNKDAAQELERHLQNVGFATFSEPLFAIEQLPFVLPTKKYSFAIITSANACEALLKCGFAKDIKIYAVGKITAKKLESLGFVNVIYSKENSARSLKKLIITEEENTNGLYLRGEIINSEIALELENKAFEVDEIIVYKTKEAREFSSELCEFSKNNKFEFVLIFSKNSARIFCELARKHNLLEYFKQSQILCLSWQICDEIKKSGFIKLETFEELPFLKNFYE